MKKLLGLTITIVCAWVACFGAPTATRTYVDKAVEAEAARADAAIASAANTAKTSAVAEAKAYTDAKIAGGGGSGGVTNGVTEAQAEAIAALAASAAKSEAIAAAADDATIKANAAKSEAISTAGANVDTKISTALAPYAKSEAVASNYLSKVDAAVTYQAKGNYATTALLNSYATKTEMTTALNTASNTIVGAVDAQISGKANANEVVKLTGTQSIAGSKTFTTLPKIPQTPSAVTDAASKGYVDSSTNALMNAVNAKGYLTQHQSLANYSTTAQMNTAIKNATNGLAKASEVTAEITTATSTLAKDADVVKLSTAQTINGNKTYTGQATFSGSASFSGTTTLTKTPTSANHVANKGYVDDTVKAATNSAVATAVATANAYADSKEGYGKAYDLRPLTNNLTLEDHSTYYVTIAQAMSITLPLADTHVNARCIQIYFECNLSTAPQVSVVKNGNTIVYQPEDYGGPRESSEYFQPKANGKTLVHIFEVKPNVYYIQQINLKDWEY